MADEKVVFDVVTDGSDTPHADAAGVSYKLSTGTRSFNTIEKYSGSDGAIINGQMSILTPTSAIGDELILSADITPTDIFDVSAENIRGVAIVTGTPDVPVAKCLVTSGDAGLAEYGTFVNSFSLTAAWKVLFTFDFVTNTADTPAYITEGTGFLIHLVPASNRLQVYDGTWYNFDFLTIDFTSGTGEHTFEIYQNGSNITAVLDNAETIDKPGVIITPHFAYALTNSSLQDKFIGKVIQLIYYSDGAEVRNYVFNDESTVQSVDSVSSEELAYTNVAASSWVDCTDAGTPDPDTYLEYFNDLTPRYTDNGVPDITIGYPRISYSENVRLNAISVDNIRRYDYVQSKANGLADVAAWQVDGNGEAPIYCKMMNLVNLDNTDATISPEKQSHGPQFITSGAISGNPIGSIFAGHWMYRAFTTLDGELNSSALTFDVANGSVIANGEYVCIHDGSFGSPEHCLVTGVSTNTITVAARGYRSDALVHSTGSRIATHVDGVTGTDPAFVYNMTTDCPVDGVGDMASEWLGKWNIDNYNVDHNGDVVTGVTVKGIAIDIDFRVPQDSSDTDNDGDNDTANTADTGNHLVNGLNIFYDKMRSLNTSFYIGSGLSESAGHTHTHGGQQEGWPVIGAFYHQVATPVESAYVNIDELMSNFFTRIRECRSGSLHHCVSKTPSNTYPEGKTVATNQAHRFSMATALMGGAFYGQQPGDGTSATGNRDSNPWYDEFAVDLATGNAVLRTANQATLMAAKHWLGDPVGTYYRDFVDADFDADNVIYDYSFDSNTTDWSSTNCTLTWDDIAAKCSTHTTYDPLINSSCVTELNGPALTGLTSGNYYTVTFKARSSFVREIRHVFGYTAEKFIITTEWRNYTRVVKATGTSQNQFFRLGRESSDVWIKDIKIYPGEINAFVREFDNGLVLANANSGNHTFNVGAGYKRINGTQDSAANDGTVTSSVVLPPYDGLILIKT